MTLTSLRSCSLGFWVKAGCELDIGIDWQNHMNMDDWEYNDPVEEEDRFQLPNLAAVPHLMGLTLFGDVDVPPSLGQLSGLSRLEMALCTEGGWGMSCLSSLGCLTHLSIGGTLPGKLHKATNCHRRCDLAVINPSYTLLERCALHPQVLADPELLATLPHLEEVGILQGQPNADEYEAWLRSKVPSVKISTYIPS
jgi:hypothetical protein